MLLKGRLYHKYIPTAGIYASFRLHYRESERRIHMFVAMTLMMTRDQHVLFGEYLYSPADFNKCKICADFVFLFQ
jgi:hypothetical protein